MGSNLISGNEILTGVCRISSHLLEANVAVPTTGRSFLDRHPRHLPSSVSTSLQHTSLFLPAFLSVAFLTFTGRDKHEITSLATSAWDR